MLNILCLLSFAIRILAISDSVLGKALTKQADLAEKYRVSGFPNVSESRSQKTPIMFAGQIPLYRENNTHFFFWKFVDPEKSPAAEKKTIFWLNGGPGCSSITGALSENGPYRLNEKQELIHNQGSWHKKGDIVYVDQPVNTGFSYSDKYDTELYDVSRHFMKFLENYFEVFPDDRENDIVLAGESYGGQFLPYIARDILRYNQISSTNYNLKGLLIGNGYISPAEQSRTFLLYALYEGLILPNNANWMDIMKAQAECEEAYMEYGNPFGKVTEICSKVLLSIIKSTATGLDSSNPKCYNIYDYALTDYYPNCGSHWPSDFENLNSFINQDHVKSSLNVPLNFSWADCSPEVSNYLKPKNSLAAIDFFPQLLQDIGVVLFNGNKDFICNHVATEIIISKMKWDGQTGFSRNGTTYSWRHNGNIEGHIQTERNLTYVNVYDGSHFVVFSKPGPSQALIDILYGSYVLRKSTDGKCEICTFPVLE